MKTQIILALIIAALFTIYSFSVYELGKSKAQTKIIKDTDTLRVEIKIPDSTGYKPQFIKIKEKVNVDSLFEVAKKYWQDRVKPDTVYPPMLFVAHLDSTYEDDLLKADINLISRIPIDPEAYYKLKFDVKKETIFVPTYVKDESFFHNRFIPYFGIGISYGIDSKTIEPALQLGFGFRLN